MECVGVTVRSTGGIREMKTYFDGMPDINVFPGISSGIRDIIKKFPEIKLADTAVYRSLEGGEAEYAVNLNAAGTTGGDAVNAINKLAETFESEVDFYDELLQDMKNVEETLPCLMIEKTTGSRLNNIGFRFDHHGRIIGVKYYLNIKKSLSFDNGFDTDIAELVSRLSGVDPLSDVFSKPGRSFYYPVLLGVNVFTGTPKETKVYYDSGRIAGKKQDIVVRAGHLLTDLDLSTVLSEDDISLLYSNGLFLRGIGLHPREPEKIKIYIVER